MVDGHSWSTLDGPLGIRFFPQWDPAYMAELQKYIRDFKKIKNCFWCRGMLTAVCRSEDAYEIVHMI